MASGSTRGLSSSLRRSMSDPSVGSPDGEGDGPLSAKFNSFRDRLASRSFGRKKESRTYGKEWVISLDGIDLIATMGSGGTGEVGHGVWQGLPGS